MARETLTDLTSSGVLAVGTELYHPARRYKEREVTARVVRGGIELDGTTYSSPSGAAVAIAGSPVNGWSWWRVRATGRPLAELRSKHGPADPPR